jgi:transcriptional regulator with XRE-family HTH domain
METGGKHTRMRGVGERLVEVRSKRMWTQARLAREAGVSPTTVSGIETGRISRPHFGTLAKLARVLDVDPRLFLSSGESVGDGSGVSLSMEWVRIAREEDFEREIEGASLESLETLSGELEDARRRLQTLYGEFPRGSEQRKFIKRQIREVAAQSGSVTTSAMFHRQRKDTGRENAKYSGEKETE